MLLAGKWDDSISIFVVCARGKLRHCAFGTGRAGAPSAIGHRNRIRIRSTSQRCRPVGRPAWGWVPAAAPHVPPPCPERTRSLPSLVSLVTVSASLTLSPPSRTR